MLAYFAAIWNILRTLGIFLGHFQKLRSIGYIFPGLGILQQEKSGNTGSLPA
jgi:uncharacterized membrane protein